MADITLTSLQKYEQGIVSVDNISAGSLRRMANVLGCTMEELMDPE